MAEDFWPLLRNCNVAPEEFRELLKRHENLVCHIVSAPDICLPFMLLEEKEIVITKTKNDGETAGARQLIAYLLSCQHPNWPKIFLEALQKAEYQTLAHALLKRDLTKINDMKEKKELLQKSEVIFRDVHASALLPYLSESLRLSDSEHIQKEESNKGPRAAILLLLHALRRSDNLCWFEHLIEALKHNRHSHIIEVLLPSSEERALHLDDQSENSEDDYRRGMKQTENQFTMRNYQWELAEPALSGLNCIIVAPTGSGKTLVAVTICRRHLDSACTDGKPRRVAFLVRTNPMLQQQFDVFTNALKGTKYTVSKLGGNNEEGESFSVASSASVMVISAQILENALFSGSLPSLSHFSLLVLDECHHTMKRHMYNRVLLFYLKQKLCELPSALLPQIVGLTASVGTGDKQNVVNHVLQLCANLDCPNIITVRKNCEELAEYITQVEPEVIEVGQRVDDKFLPLIFGAMDEVEGLLVEVCHTLGVDKRVLGKEVPRDNRGEPVYEQWVISTQRCGVTLSLADVDAERRVCCQILACTEYLRAIPLRGECIYLWAILPAHYEKYTVSKLGGNNEEGESFSVASSASVMVISAQILENALFSGSLPSLSHFSLLVLDECHHTMKRHMYNRVLLFYLKQKLCELPSALLPQIVGLTASVGTGDKQNVVNHVLQLCANLDCPNIITVRKNCEELAEYITQVEPEIIEVGQRVDDKFLPLISGAMDEVEGLLVEVCHTLGVDKRVLGKEVPRNNRGEPVYEQWVISTQRCGVTLSLADVDAERRVCCQILACTEYLRSYNTSLIINNTARTCDAASFLLKFSDKMRNAFDYYGEEYKLERTVMDTEKKLIAILHRIEDRLKRLQDADSGESPQLVRLQGLLKEQYKTTPTTKTLLFVCTRDLGQVLIDWMEKNPFLAELKPRLLLGRCRSTAQGSSVGMTHLQQNSVLNMFSKEASADAADDASSCHLLIATSVADEGIDIRACNLVVLLDHVGNVIRMVQTRGRGRAKDSRCVLIASEHLKSAQRYRNTLAQEHSMANAIRKIQAIDQDSIKAKLLELQMESVQQFNKELTQETKAEDEVYNLLCIKCQKQALTTRDLRLIKNAHHTVIKPGFEDSIKKRPHHEPICFDGFYKNAKMFHSSCGQDWGVSGTYQGCTYPVLKIKSFVFQKPKTGEKRHLKNWKDLQIVIPPLDTDTEMEMEMEISSEEASSNLESQ